MAASPARIPMMTSDGIVLSRVDTAVRAAHANAVDEGDSERELFYDTEADANAMIDEYWNWRKTVGRPHEAVEVDTSFGLGTAISLAPAVPKITAIDERRGLNQALNIRAYASDYTIERYSLELLG